MKHTISVLVKNESGILSRITNLFSSRGYKIDSITMAPVMDDAHARATIVTDGDKAVIEQIKKQLNKLVPVINVSDSKLEQHSYELIFVKVYAANSAELLTALVNFETKILGIKDNIYTIRIVCEESNFKSLMYNLKPFDLKDMVRSGAVAI